MPRTAHPASIAHPAATAKSASFVVLLTFNGTYRGMAGPFLTADAAHAWVDDLLSGHQGWSYEVEPVVSPQALPATGEARPARPSLSIVR